MRQCVVLWDEPFVSRDWECQTQPYGKINIRERDARTLLLMLGRECGWRTKSGDV